MNPRVKPEGDNLLCCGYVRRHYETAGLKQAMTSVVGRDRKDSDQIGKTIVAGTISES
jgi:hypothetical protein